MKMIRKALSVLLTIGIIVGLAPTMMPSAGAENFIGYDWLTEVVSLDIPIYFQTGDNTCGSASAVMVLRYLAQKGEISFGNSITDISFRGDDSPIEPAPLAERMNNYDTAAFEVGQFFEYDDYYNTIKLSLEKGNPVPILAYDYNTTYFTWPYEAHWVVICGIFRDDKGQLWFDIREPRADRRAGNKYCDQNTGRVLIPTYAMYQMGYNDVHESKSYRFIYSTKKRSFACDHSAGYTVQDRGDGIYAAICNNCHKEIPIEDITTTGGYKLGVYNVKGNSGDEPNIYCSYPYKENKKGTYSVNDKLNVVGVYKNAHGNVWFKLDNGYYIWNGWLEYVSAFPKPSAPTNLKAENLTSTTAKISWSAVSGATSYEAQFSRENGSWNNDTEYSSGTSYTVTGLNWSSYSYYKFRIRAKNSSGESDWAVVTLNKPSTTSVPAAPTGLTGVRSGSANVQLSWNAVSGATKYKLEYKTANMSSWIETDGSKEGLTTNSVTEKGFGWSYDYVDFRVYALNSAGTSAASQECRVYKDVATYTITYSANGGTGAPSSQTKTHGVNLTLSSTKPTRTSASAGNYTVTLNANGGNLSTTSLTAARTTSYSFKNWNTASNGSGTSYNAGGTYTTNASATLYAQWNSSTKTASVTLPTPTRPGYTFKGWATSAGATSGVTGSYTPTGNVTLYATWEKVYYLDVNITLDGKEIANAWDGWASFDVYINGKEDRKAVGDYYSEWPSGTEYEIKNIVTTAGKVYNGVIAGSLKGKITGDTSIMLSFSSQYTVTFNPNDGSVSPTTKTVTYGHTYGDLPTPTRIGYTFAGWFTAASGGNQVTASTTVNLTTNQTLYAHWAAIPVTSIKLNKYSVSLSVGETYTLTGTVSPSDAADTRVHWWSDNTSVVTVDQNGKITAVGAGSAVIVAEAYGGDNIKANCTVTVTEYYLRLRGFLNQTDWNNLGSYGTADIYINGKLVKDDVAEYVVCWPAGTTYEIKDIKANEGYVYEGVKAGSLTGTIDAAHTDVVLSFSKLYTVTYDANGGIGAPAVQEKTHGTELILSTVEPTRDGYTFLGWAESADATEAKYHPGDAYSFNESITLYAVWEENAEVEFLDCYAYLDTGWGDDEYMLRLSFRNNREAQAYGIDYLIDAYGNDIPSGADSLDKNANVLPFFTPLEPGVHNCLICIHYVDEDVEGGYLVEGQTYRWRGYVTIDGKTYYSQELSFVFTLDGTRFPNHTVTFNANGGENAPEPQIKNYKTPLTLTMDEPSFDGHTFIGWAADKEATEATYQPGDLYFRNANITLYAVWEENETPKPDGGVICVGSTTGRAGDTVDIAISLKDNPGVISMLLNVHYDNSVLTLTGYTDEGKLGTEYHNKNYSIMPYVLSWADDTATTDNTYTGTIVTLHFKISDNAAEGNYPITISYSSDDSDIYNSDWETVEFSIENGSVTVSNVVLGDVNGDGKVNGMDRTFLARHVAKWAGYSSDDIVYSAADVNGDGKVNGMDRTYLARYVAKWSGYEELIPYKPNMKLPELSVFGSNEHEPESATDGQAAISVEKTEAVAGKTVDIDISLENNPGIISMLLSVSYDSEALTLTGYTDAGKLGTEYHNKDYSMNPYILSWADDTATSDNKYSGVIVTLHFTVSENAAVGSYPITVSYSKENADIYNSNWETVDFSLEQGLISVKGQSPVENVYTLSGTAAFWNDTDNAEYYLYSAETADADIRAAWQAGTHTELEGIEDYAVTKGEIEAATVDGKSMKTQSFSFEAVKAGEYKLAIFKPGKYVPRVVTVTVTDEAVELGSVKLWLYGDVNCDGKVDSKDATQITRYANLKSSVFDTGDEATRADRLIAADVSGDGAVDSKDATQITRFANLKSSIFDKLK